MNGKKMMEGTKRKSREIAQSLRDFSDALAFSVHAFGKAASNAQDACNEMDRALEALRRKYGADIDEEITGFDPALWTIRSEEMVSRLPGTDRETELEEERRSQEDEEAISKLLNPQRVVRFGKRRK